MQKTQRLAYVDGLRGALAFVVFVHHFLFAFYPEFVYGGPAAGFFEPGNRSMARLIALTPLNLLFNPGMAVVFFFLLSGFIQTRSYFESPSLLFLKRSLLKRYFRLALPVAGVLCLVFAFHRLGLIKKYPFPVNEFSNGWAASLLPDTFSFADVVYHGFVDSFLGNSRYYQVLWTMPIELMNSYIVLFMLLASHRVKSNNFVLPLWLLVQLFVLKYFNGAAFTMGAILARVHVSSGNSGSLFSGRVVKTFCLLLGLYFASYPFVSYENAVFYSVYKPIAFFEKYPPLISYFIGTTLLLVFILSSPKTQRLFSRASLVLAGKISYMLYLVHLLLVFSFSPWFYNQLLYRCSFVTNVCFTGLATAAVVVLVSYLMYLILDRPVLTLSTRFAARVFPYKK